MWEPPTQTKKKVDESAAGSDKKEGGRERTQTDEMENEIVGTPAFLAPEVCDPEMVRARGRERACQHTSLGLKCVQFRAISKILQVKTHVDQLQ